MYIQNMAYRLRHYRRNNRIMYRFTKNNRVRRNVGDKRRMDELRVEVGVKESYKKKLVRSSLKWQRIKHVPAKEG